MKELIQSIKNFLLDIQPKLESVKNEIPVPMNIDEKITETGTIEMVEALIEEVSAISDVSDTLSENYLTPAQVGLSNTEESVIIEEPVMGESKLLKQIEILTKELENTNKELSETKVELSKFKLELSKTEQEYKNQFSLSAIKGSADEINPKEYLRQLLKNNKK